MLSLCFRNFSNVLYEPGYRALLVQVASPARRALRATPPGAPLPLTVPVEVAALGRKASLVRRARRAIKVTLARQARMVLKGPVGLLGLKVRKATEGWTARWPDHKGRKAILALPEPLVPQVHPLFRSLTWS